MQHMSVSLLDAIRTWLDDDPELKHFVLENSYAEDFDANWITCPCSSHILVSIKESLVIAMSKPISEDKRMRLPTFYEIPASHPQFFEMIKYSLLTYHQTYL